MKYKHKSKLPFLIRSFALILALTMLTGCAASTASEDSDTASAVISEAYEETSADTSSTEIKATTLSSTTNTETESSTSTVTSSDDMFTNRDLRITYDESESVYISLSGNTAECDSSAVTISGSTVTITEEGTYILSGTLDDGMIIIDTDSSEKVQLVLDGVSITSVASAAIYVRQADKVFITTAEWSENYLANGGEYIAIDDNNIDGVIFSKDDLTLNGAGTLTIEAAAGHGVVCKDDLIIASGTYTITAEEHCIEANDSVRIADGEITLTAGKDGIHAENDEDTELGFVYIIGGYLDITANGDGISAGSYLQISEGTFVITTGGGSTEAETTDGWGRGSDFWGSMTTAEQDSVSTKGLKADSDVIISGGTFTINSCDDAIHSNGDVTVSGGFFSIQAGDDGIHADNALVISDGEINITESYEGLEGLTIDITGGTIDLTASDDGVNAGGGNDSSGFFGFADAFSSTSSAYLSISGGTLYVNASGDGLDSNGSMYISGGMIYVSGPTTSTDGALDYDREAVITGGVLVAVSAGGMEESFSSSSTQGVITVSLSTQQAGTAVSIEDSSGNVLASFTPGKSYSTVIISCPELTVGESYTISAGSSSTTISMSSLIYGSSGMMGGMGNMGDMSDFNDRGNSFTNDDDGMNTGGMDMGGADSNMGGMDFGGTDGNMGGMDFGGTDNNMGGMDFGGMNNAGGMGGFW